MMSRSIFFLLICSASFFSFFSFFVFGAGEEREYSPIFPPDIEARVKRGSPTFNGKKIPTILWIAAINSTEVNNEWEHVKEEKKRNPGWTVNVWDNADKDKFMRDYYAGSSILWAYENINPIYGGAAKADIWRYCALYIFGGVYIDADSFLTKPLDGIITKDDEMIITYENNNFDGDWCYSPNSNFSTIRFMKTHPLVTTLNIFYGRNILNWCIFSAPGHFFLRRTLESFVKLVRLEYIGLSNLKMNKHDKFSKHVYCTTGPSLFTAACREAVLELHERALGGNYSRSGSGNAGVRIADTGYPPMVQHRLGSRDFIKEGGVFKAINNVKGDKTHYTQVSHQNFLQTYAPEEEQLLAIQAFTHSRSMRGTLIMGRYKKSVYALVEGVRRPFNGMDVLLAYNYSLDQVIHLSDFVISHIPLGDSLPMPNKVN